MPPPAAQLPAPVTSLNAYRKAANRVKVGKDPKAVSGCSKLGGLKVPASGSGVYEVAGHNFYYGDAEELIRLKTAEAGGDHFLILSKTKAEISGEIYRCGKGH